LAVAGGLTTTGPGGPKNKLCYIAAMHRAIFFFSYFWFSNAIGGREF
jgi:preprotein translocase subunit SecY